ncbi:MAG: DNA repair protein RecO [Ruminococcaceae bacterium]|nr:DNA repair protein RecO [Oscillospiraceae bacterium]
MAEIHHFPALVIRETEYGEHDKLLTLLTAEQGKKTVLVKGAKSLKNANMASSQLLCYSEFTVKERNGFYTLSEAALIEQFFGLRKSLERYAAAQYAADVVGEISVENNDEAPLLQLLLNTLYMLSETDREVSFIKAVFEIRLAALSGFCPDLRACVCCGQATAERYYLDVMNGTLSCLTCFGTATEVSSQEDVGRATVILPLSDALRRALRYATESPAKRIYSFSLPKEEEEALSHVCETYLLHQLERGFRTLDFYHRVRGLG